MWKIPLFETSFDKMEIEAVHNVIYSGWLTMGDITKEFENRFAEFLGIKHVIAVTNGTAALHLANKSLNIGKGDEIICPSLTFVAGANSIYYTGAMPVFADIESQDNLCISPTDIERKVNYRTKAIQVMHYGGYPCDMDKINDIAQKYKLYIIEDCAHAPGSEYNGKKCGTLGDIACFSFFSNKNMATGEGGIVATNNDEIAKKIRLMRSHGMTTLTWDRARGHAFSYDVVELGFNYRIDDLRSAIGLVQLNKLQTNNKKREQLVKLYRIKLDELNYCTIPFSNVLSISSYHIFPILLDRKINRSEFMEYLKKRGIQTSIHYPPIHKFDYYCRIFKNNYILSITEDVAKRLVTLPLYPNMKTEDIYYICEVINEFLKNLEV